MSALPGVWDCPHCGTRHYNVRPDNAPAGAKFIHCSHCKKKTPLDKKTKEPVNIAGQRGKKMISRSIMKIEDPKRRITVTIELDDKGFAGENSGTLCRLTNDLNDAFRKYANAHEIKVAEYGKVLKADKANKKGTDKK